MWLLWKWQLLTFIDNVSSSRLYTFKCKKLSLESKQSQKKWNHFLIKNRGCLDHTMHLVTGSVCVSPRPNDMVKLNIEWRRSINYQKGASFSFRTKHINSSSIAAGSFANPGPQDQLGFGLRAPTEFLYATDSKLRSSRPRETTFKMLGRQVSRHPSYSTHSYTRKSHPTVHITRRDPKNYVLALKKCSCAWRGVGSSSRMVIRGLHWAFVLSSCGTMATLLMNSTLQECAAVAWRCR